jgi:hypothetical protein
MKKMLLLAVAAVTLFAAAPAHRIIVGPPPCTDCVR